VGVVWAVIYSVSGHIQKIGGVYSYSRFYIFILLM